MACGILVPQPGIKLVPLATKLQRSNHWTPGNSTYTIIFLLKPGTKGYKLYNSIHMKYAE